MSCGHVAAVTERNQDMLNEQVLENCTRAEYYYRVAWEYLAAYDAVAKSKTNGLELTSAKLFLLCHALETAMKGWLILREGISQEKLRKKYGHDLAKLAFSAGQHYPALLQNAKHLDRLNDSYWGGGTRDYEYPEGEDRIEYIPPDELVLLVKPCLQDLIQSIVQERQSA